MSVSLIVLFLLSQPFTLMMAVGIAMGIDGQSFSDAPFKSLLFLLLLAYSIPAIIVLFAVNVILYAIGKPSFFES